MVLRGGDGLSVGALVPHCDAPDDRSRRIHNLRCSNRHLHNAPPLRRNASPHPLTPLPTHRAPLSQIQRVPSIASDIARTVFGNRRGLWCALASLGGFCVAEKFENLETE